MELTAFTTENATVSTNAIEQLRLLIAVSAEEESRLRASFIVTVILTAFFGFFTILAAVAAYVLFRKGINQVPSAVMLSAIVMMWASTTAYWLTALVGAFDTYHSLRGRTSVAALWVEGVQQCMSSDAASSCAFDGLRQGLPLILPVFAPRDCAGTVALTFNVVLGDAIVWWRAWILWRLEKRAVLWFGMLLVLCTLATSIVDTKDSCSGTGTFDLSSPFDPDNISLSAGALFGGDPWGIAATALSLFTNTAATLLIAWKAWGHRRLVRSHLREGSRRTQVERTLLLLVESGVLYCALWMIVIVYQLVALKLGESAFAYGFYYVMGGCLIPLIGMYPTLVIIVCALDKSYFERQFIGSRLGQGLLDVKSAVPARHDVSEIVWSRREPTATSTAISEREPEQQQGEGEKRTPKSGAQDGDPEGAVMSSTERRVSSL